MTDNYIMLFTDSHWGHHDCYYPVVYQFTAGTEDELCEQVAKAIIDTRWDDNDIKQLFGVKVEDEATTNIDVTDLVCMLKGHTHNVVEFLTGKDWHCGELLLTKDNDRVWNKLFKAGMPGNPINLL